MIWSKLRVQTTVKLALSQTRNDTIDELLQFRLNSFQIIGFTHLYSTKAASQAHQPNEIEKIGFVDCKWSNLNAPGFGAIHF